MSTEYENLDNERTAIEAVYVALESLDHFAKMRVLDYVKNFCTDIYAKERAASLERDNPIATTQGGMPIG